MLYLVYKASARERYTVREYGRYLGGRYDSNISQTIWQSPRFRLNHPQSPIRVNKTPRHERKCYIIFTYSGLPFCIFREILKYLSDVLLLIWQRSNFLKQCFLWGLVVFQISIFCQIISGIWNNQLGSVKHLYTRGYQGGLNLKEMDMDWACIKEGLWWCC